MLGRIQNDLFDLGADLATPETDKPLPYEPLRITEAQVDRLEREIDQLNQHLSPLRSFVLPGGTAAAAALHLARTVCRRAERRVVELTGQPGEVVSPAAVKYPQPAVGFPVRGVPLRQREGRARRALGPGPEPLTPTRRARDRALPGATALFPLPFPGSGTHYSRVTVPERRCFFPCMTACRCST